MKTIATALILGLLVSAETSAKNVTITHDPVTVATSIDFNGSFAAGAGSFRETWTFTLDTAGSLLVTDAAGSAKYVLIGPDRSRIRLDQDPLNVPITLAAGTYTLDFSGNANNDTGASIAGSIAPVPEPASYAMFLAGVGLISLVARRRNQAKVGSPGALCDM